MRVDPRLPILVFMVIIAMMALMTMGGPTAPPDDRVMCDGCHDDFEPFSYSIDAPSEVPQDEPFPLRVHMRNNGDHTLLAPSVLVSLGEGSTLILEGGEPWTYEQEEVGSVGWRQSVDRSVEVGYGGLSATFNLAMSTGPLDYVSLTVMGPEGGQWATGSRGSSNAVISLGQDDLQEGGRGLWTVIVNHEQGPRTVTFDLSIEIEYGPSIGIQDGPDIGPGESHTFMIDLVGVAQGDGSVQLTIGGTAYYEHNEVGHDDRLFQEDATVDIEVGDEFVGGSGGGADGGGGASILSAGQALGFISAFLLVGSLATSGHLPRLPKRGNLHCYVSKALAGVFFIHWLTLWVGPYGSTYGGIGTGSVMLVLILMLALGGSKPQLLEGKVMGWSNRLLHRNMTYALVLVLVVHILLNGSHFAFVR